MSLKPPNGLFLLILLFVLLPACVRQKVDLVVYETQVAQKIFLTQTAAVPTATITIQPTITPTITLFPTLTPTPIPRGVVLSQVLNLRAGPSIKYPVIGGLKEGELVSVLGKSGQCTWLKVKTQPGVEGWVSGENTLIKVDTPCAALPRGTYRPANGEIIIDMRSGSGSSQFKVLNGTQQDGLVVMARETGAAVLAFYVQSQQEFNINAVPDGSYQIFFMLGSEWDGEAKTFRQLQEIKKMDMPLEFKTTSTSFAVWTISLNPVPEGSGSASEVPFEQFPILP